MKKSILLIFFQFSGITLCDLVYGQQLTLNPSWWQSYGNVRAMVADSENQLLYVGGDFTYVGPVEPHGAQIDSITAIVDFQFANPDARVEAVIPDGEGGWYIGGHFTSVENIPRNRLAHIDADGNVTPWNPNCSGRVETLARKGDTIFAGGFFSLVGGQSRSNIVAIDANTGQVLGWNPGASSTVTKIVPYNNLIYAGGNFQTIGGADIRGIAALDPITALPTSWNPNCNSSVFEFGFIGNTVYVAGGFSEIGGQNRNRLGAIDLTSGLATAWNPNPQGSAFPPLINSLQVLNNVIYVGGSFSSVGGANRNHLAALNSTNGNATSWNPNPSGTIQSLHAWGDAVYVGGSFSTIGGQSRQNLAALNLTDGNATQWSVLRNGGTTTAIAVWQGKVYVGGYFTSIGGRQQNRLAAFDMKTGILSDWKPSVGTIAPHVVNALALKGDTLFVGGNFTTVNEETRTHLAAISTSSSELLDWNPQANQLVRALHIWQDELFVGGNFTAFAENNRDRIASFYLKDASLTDWNPGADNPVWSIASNDKLLYIGGQFTKAGGETRNRLAAFDNSKDTPDTWDPDADNIVRVLYSHDDLIYIGGDFTQVGNGNRNRIAAIKVSDGTATDWNPDADDAVLSIAITGDYVFLGGNFTTINSQGRNRLASVERSSGRITSLNPNPTGSFITPAVFTFLIHERDLYTGGFFQQINGEIRNNLAAFSVCLPPELPQVTVSGVEGCIAPTTFSIVSGQLNDATHWQWYKESCGDNSLGTGSEITHIPPWGEHNYYVRGEGGCVIPQQCTKTTITATDLLAPEIEPIGELVLETESAVCYIASETLPVPVVTDNCGVKDASIMGSMLENLAPGFYTTTWIAEDYAGNTSTMSYNFTVVDNEDPQLTAPAGLIITTDPGTCHVADLQLDEAVATDNCQVSSLVNDAPEIFLKGETVVVWTATDAAGNSATATQSIVVTDTEAPVPNAAALPDVSALCRVTSLSIPTASDNCSGQRNGVPDVQLPITESTTITWSFTDESGNTTQQTQQVVISNVNVTVEIVARTLTALNDIEGVSYQWINCINDQIIENETGRSFTPVDDGSYAVRITQENCIATSECFTISSVSTDFTEALLFKVFPNPSDGSFFLETPETGRLEILDMKGRIAFATQIEQTGQTRLHTGIGQPGVYLVRLITVNELMIQRIVVR